MNPHMVMALLAKYTDLAKKDAEKIAKELELITQPSTYKDAEVLVDKIVAGARK